MANSNEPKLTDKLLAKISLQADDLLCQKNEIMLKDNKILELETQLSKCGFTPPAAGTSDLAKRRRDDARHREQLNALQKQLDTANKRLRESGTARNQLVVDLEHKARECRFMENRCDELQQENAKLLTRLEAVTLGEGSGPVKSPTALKARSQSLMGQLKAAKDALKLKDAELDQAGRELEESKMRVSTLEKALEYRADEIGLSGHADLLAKLAGFRGEVTALKKDLLDKRNRLHDIEADRQSVSESNLTLQEQVAQLQQRLAQSRHDLQRLQKGESLLEQLAQTESERDVLLEFIQEDLRKNSDLTATTDKAMREAAEAQRAAASAQAQLKKQEELVDSQAQYIRDLEGGRSTLQSERSAARDQLATVTREAAELRARLERKETEAQEQSKVNMAMLEQLKSKEDQLVSATTELATLRVQLEGQGATSSRLMDERRGLESQVQRLTEELVPLREQALLFDAASQLRPEMAALQRDYDAALTERRALMEEVQRLRFHDKQLQDLRGDLEKVRTSTAALAEPDEPANGPGLSASQRHVMWTGVPALRQVSPILYENVRAMFQDLFDKEAECRELSALVKRFKDEQTYRDEDYRSDYQKMSDMEERMARRAAEDRACIDNMDRELVRARSAKLVVEQVRLVLQSTLGSSAADYLSSSQRARFQAGNNGNRMGTPNPSGARRAHAPGSRQFRDPLDEEHHSAMDGAAYEFDDSFTLKRNDDLLNSSLEAIAGAELHEQFGSSRANPRQNTDDALGGLPDEALPSVLSQALARHLSSVSALEACERQLRDVTAERDHLSAELSKTSAECAGIRQRLADAQETSADREHSHIDQYRKMESDLSLAVSLNEKQNALTITLEARVEELKRQLSVQSAQVVSFQQQEEVFKHEMLGMFGNFWRAVTSRHGTMDVSRGNWFCQAHGNTGNIEHIVQSAAEILSVLNRRLGAADGGFVPTARREDTSPPRNGLGATPVRSPAPDVSHHYRHWQSGGTTRSPLTKANQQYIERASRGLGANGQSDSPSLLSRSLSQPFTREEFRRSGGSKSFTGLDGADERRSPHRPSLTRDNMGASRDSLAGNNHSEVLSRLQKAKTAFSFMRTDSLQDFS